MATESVVEEIASIKENENTTLHNDEERDVNMTGGSNVYEEEKEIFEEDECEIIFSQRNRKMLTLNGYRYHLEQKTDK